MRGPKSCARSCNDFVTTEVDPAMPVFDEQLAALENQWAWTQVPLPGAAGRGP